MRTVTINYLNKSNGIKSKVLIRTITIDDLNGSRSPSGPTQSPKVFIRDKGSSTLP